MSKPEQVEDVGQNTFFKFIQDSRWTWQEILIEDLVIPPLGQAPLFVDNNIVGYLNSVFIEANNPSLIFGGSLYAGGPIQIAFDFNELLVERGGAGQILKLLRYDDANQIYSAEFNPPGFPGEPFRGNLKALVANPTTTPITVTRFTLAIIKLTAPKVAP